MKTIIPEWDGCGDLSATYTEEHRQAERSTVYQVMQGHLLVEWECMVKDQDTLLGRLNESLSEDTDSRAD